MMDQLSDFQAFEERWEQVATAIVVTLLGTGVIGLVFFLIDLV